MLINSGRTPQDNEADFTAEDFPLSMSTAEIITRFTDDREGLLGQYSDCAHVAISRENKQSIDGDDDYDAITARLESTYGENWNAVVVLLDNIQG